MKPGEARAVIEEARKWELEGLITPEQGRALEARYASRAAAATGAGASSVLHALGGLVLGAAAIALVVFLDLPESSVPWALLALGWVGAFLGVGLALTGIAVGDAVAAGALVPLTFAAMGADITLVALATPFVAAPALAAIRRDVVYVPPLAALAFAIGVPMALGARFEDGWSGWWLVALFAAGAGAHAAATRSEGAWDAALAVLVAGFAVAGAFTYHDANLNWGDGGAELFVGVLILGALLAGLGLRRRGILVGATIALAVDAVVFAFDVGGLLFGVVTLLVVAGALLAGASALRRWLAD